MKTKFIVNNVLGILFLSLGAIFGAIAMYGLMILAIVATLITFAITIWLLKGLRGNVILWILGILIVVGVVFTSMDFAQVEFALKASFYIYCIFVAGYSIHLLKKMEPYYNLPRLLGMLTAALYGTAAIVAFIVGLTAGISPAFIVMLVFTMLANVLRIVFMVFAFPQV